MATDSHVIRHATDRDVVAIRLLIEGEPGAWQPHWTDDTIRQAIAAADDLAFVWVDGQRIGGFVCAHDVGFRAYVSALAVAPGSRRRGVGRALLARVQTQLDAAGTTPLVVDAWREAVPFYEKVGWVPPDAVLLARRSVVSPAIASVRERGIEVQVRLFDANACATVLDAARELAVDTARMLKTMVVMTDDDRCVLALVPVERRLALGALATALGARRCALADPATVADETGQAMGDISPLGTTELLPTVIDVDALRFDTVLVSGGRRGVELELRPQDLVDCCEAIVAPIAR